MKKNLLIFVFTLSSIFSYAQFSRSPVDEVLTFIRNNHIPEVSKYMDNYIMITLNNNQSLYSKNQTEIILKDFFDKNVASNFSIVDDGAADKVSKFAIANFDASGEKYELYILMKQKNNVFLIEEIRLNKE